MNTSNLFLWVFFICFVPNTIFGQNYKIDSTFSAHFHILEKYSLLLHSQEYAKKLSDSLIFNKVSSEYVTLQSGLPILAIHFMEDITNINTIRSKFILDSVYLDVTQEILEKWKEWYCINRKKLKWDRYVKPTEHPNNNLHLDVDFKKYYPYQIKLVN
jgi:hypothetical protein